MDYDALEKRAKLLAAWRKPGGSTPKEKSPPLYKTLVELLDAIADLRARNDALCDIISRYVDPCDVLPEDDAIVAGALAANREG